VIFFDDGVGIDANPTPWLAALPNRTSVGATFARFFPGAPTRNA
jgi:hypothetical protein